MSASGNKSGHLMIWDDNNGDRKAILALAQPELEKKAATTNKPVESVAITKQLIDHLTSMGINVHNREEMIQYLNEYGYSSIQEAVKKHLSKHTKNDVSAFHLSRNLYEVSNDIFSIDSEKKYKKEIQSFIKGLPEDTDRTSGIWYLSKDGKRAFRINASIENFEENKKETAFGFEVADWYNFENLDNIQYNEFIDRYSNDKERRTISGWLQAVEDEQGSNYNSNGLFENSQSTGNDVRLDQEALSGESNRGDNTASSRINQGESEISSFFLTPQGEVFGFVAPNGDINLDETVISPEHPIHEYTHLWDRYVFELNPKLWQTGIDIFKKTSLWNEILNNENYGKKWQAMQGMTPDKLDSLIASEVHARLTGERGREILDQIAKENGESGIIGKLKQWLLDFWKTIKSAFSPWTDEQLQRLNSLAEKDIDKALDELENLNTDSYDKILKRFSQEELRGSNENLIQAEAIIQRGERGADRKNTQGYGERAKQQEQQIESWALME